MTKLSPAAQAVADATEILVHKGFSGRQVAAAALRAAANQIPYLPKNCSSYDVNMQDGREEVREKLLAIADELEAQ